MARPKGIPHTKKWKIDARKRMLGNTQGFKKGQQSYWKGKKLSENHKIKLKGKRPNTEEEKNHRWNINIGYRGIHHWANKSHKYKRELTDWISLCVKCHKKYDGDYRRNTT